MKKIVLSITLLSTVVAFGQKKEIANAVKAIDANDTTAASSEIAKADALIGDKTYLLEPSLQEQYYYAKGLALLKSGKTTEGAAVLAKIADLGKQSIFSGKDNDKNKVYFVGKAEADQKGNGLTLKEEKYAPTLANKIGNSINPTLQTVSKQASDDYEAKKFGSAGDKFKESYYLLKASGRENKSYLYYSGVAYAQSTDRKNDAAEVFNRLLKEGYTGVETNYVAKNKKTNQLENLDKATYELYKKMGTSSDYTDFKIENTPSKEEELYDIQSTLFLDLAKYDDAIATTEMGLKKFPNNSKLTATQSLAYYKAGKTDAFVKSLKDQIAKNPNDAVAWYNLGVITSKDPSKNAETEEAFSKSIQIDPKNKSSLINMVYFQMGDDQKAIDDYNTLRKAGKIDDANKIMEKRRGRFAKAIPFAEKLYALDPKDADIVTLLKGFYYSTQNTAKYNEFKTLEASLKK